MTPARNCCSVSSPQPTNAEHWASPAIGRSRPGADSSPNTPQPSACSTGCCTTPTSSSPKATPTACAKPEPKEASTRKHPEQPPRGGDFYLATSGDFHLAIDTARGSALHPAQSGDPYQAKSDSLFRDSQTARRRRQIWRASGWGRRCATSEVGRYQAHDIVRRSPVIIGRGWRLADARRTLL